MAEGGNHETATDSQRVALARIWHSKQHTMVEQGIVSVWSASEFYTEWGGLEYLHCNPASRKRRRKGNTVSNETVRYGLESCGTWIQEWQCWHCPVAILWVNYRPVLSSERAPHMKKQVHVRLKDMQNLVMGPKGWPNTKAYWPTDRVSQIQVHSTPVLLNHPLLSGCTMRFRWGVTGSWTCSCNNRCEISSWVGTDCIPLATNFQRRRFLINPDDAFYDVHISVI
jgi:hypothetical protein